MRNSEWVRTLPARDLRYLFKKMYCPEYRGQSCDYKVKRDCIHCGIEYLNGTEESPEPDMANSEYIRMMSIDEMAKYIRSAEGLGSSPVCHEFPCTKDFGCEECAKKWLEKEHDAFDEFVLN